MHFAILTQYYPPEIGAAAGRLEHLAEHFVQTGHSVTVLTAMPSYLQGKIFPGYGGIWRREQRHGVNIIRAIIYPARGAGFLRRLANYLSFVLSSAILGSILLPRPDYLLVESPPLLLGLSGYWLSRLKSTRLIFDVADLWPESGVALGVLRRRSFAFRVGEWLERFCYRKSWLVAGQSKTILQDVHHRFPEVRVFHLSNGVDTSRFGQEKKDAAARTALSSNGHFLSVYAGLHGLAQGLEQILAAAELLGREEDFQFVFVGDGPCREELEKRARVRGLNNVRFLGPRPADQIPGFLASADALLVSMKGAIHGMVPVKLYEAMGSGRPLVLMGNGEAAQVVREAKVGMVVEPGDISGIVAALRRLQGDSRLAQTMGENGRQAAVERFDRNRIARNFVSFLEERLQA